MNKQTITPKNDNNSFSPVENEILVASFWKDNNIFEKTIKKEAPKGDYFFYDGPPFATGTPHYGHLVGSVIKDVIPRYATMKGYRVERKWGWDCHGLPIENIVEKELGMKTKKDIEDLGVEKFNSICRERVSTYINDWKGTITRLGRFVDMENPYRTMDLPFMESVWWVFKNLWEKNLIYKDNRSMHICPRCETTLSHSEVSEGYKDVKDLSVIAKLEILKDQKILNFEVTKSTYFLAWTTTPWTLIGNVALAVGLDIDYVLVENKKEDVCENYILAKDIFLKENTSFHDKLAAAKIILEFKGSDLVNKKYRALFDYYFKDETLLNRENGWQVYGADFVNTEDGTGIVHIAPAFGEDDMALGKDKKLPFVQHVGLNGVFTTEVIDFQGLNVKPNDDRSATDVEIIKNLAHAGLLFHKEKYEHSYPHCWRCDTPLINYATSSWFVNILKIKKDLLKNAESINWTPNHLKEGRFGKWLEGARDWSISRQRFWASCIPIWECACGERQVIGSVMELEKLSGEKITDIHKDKMDKITFPCSACGGTMKRIPDVLDCWFESGAMPYAQMHYPFENKEKLESSFPANFIAEGVDQTRTWFYYLHVLSGAVMGSEGFRNVISNGIVLAEDGKKMSKKLKNYPDPNLILEKYGADALRSYLLSSPLVMGENFSFSEDGVQASFRKNVMLLWNVYKFYETFSFNLDNSSLSKKIESNNVLDIWILSELKVLIKELNISLDSNHVENRNKEINLPKVMRNITEFIDELSTWYLRRSRERFKAENEEDKIFALRTTREVLLELSKAIAPFMPFMAEGLYQKITGNNFKEIKSVHLEAWPETRELNTSELLISEKMSLVREIVVIGLAARDEKSIKIRQMLGGVKISVKKGLKYPVLENDFLTLITDELNILKAEISFELDQEGNIEVELDTEITPELKLEGIKREFIRSINLMRKDAALNISDLAKVYIAKVNSEFKALILPIVNDLKEGTLSEEIIFLDENIEIPEVDLTKELKLEGFSLMLGIKRL